MRIVGVVVQEGARGLPQALSSWDGKQPVLLHLRGGLQLDVVQRLSQRGEVWVEGGIEHAEDALDLTVAGARHVVVSATLPRRQLDQMAELVGPSLVVHGAPGTALLALGRDLGAAVLAERGPMPDAFDVTVHRVAADGLGVDAADPLPDGGEEE